MNRLLRLGLLLFAACFVSETRAQDLPGSRSFGSSTRTVSGSVVIQGAMVGNVRVTVGSASRTFHRTVFADGSGSFSISGVPVGSCTFQLEAEGYQTQRETVDIPPGSGVFLVQFLMRAAASARSPSSKDPSVSVSALSVPQGARNEFAAGQRELNRKHMQEARRHFEKALEKYAKFPQALRALALLDLAEQQPERAEKHLQSAVEIDPAYADGHFTLSHVLNELGRHREALDAAQKAIALRPNMWQAQYQRGVAALAQGQEEVVLEACERMEAGGGPDVPEVRLLRAGVWLRRQQYVEARAALLEFLRLAPNHPLGPLAKRTLEDLPNAQPPTLE